MEQNNENMQNVLVTLASEITRFQSVCERITPELEVEQRGKFTKKANYFFKQVLNAFSKCGIKTIIYANGSAYDIGMAVTPLNIDEFQPNDRLVITQTLEPTIMLNDTVVKQGTVILGAKEQ